MTERDDKLRLRRFDLESHSAEPYQNEMPPRWELTPDGKNALVWRVKGSVEWPVLDLDTDQVVHRIPGRGHNEPVVAFRGDGGAYVAVFDQIHELDSLFGHLSEGVRLKNDNSGSHVGGLSLSEDGLLSAVWVGRGEPPEMVGVETVQDLIGAINRDQESLVRSLTSARTVGDSGRVVRRLGS